MNTQSHNEQNNDKMSPQRYSKLFLLVLVIYSLVFIGYLVYAHCTSCKSQQRIIECYAKHIEKADSLYCNIVKYNKDILVANVVLSDSLIKESDKKSHNPSVSQKQNSSHIIIEDYLKEIDILHKQYAEKLAKDSLRLSTERELLEGQTKAMLELHLDKVEHEYSNITMWGAVLTILFLVFSFYSIFKLDELIRQGNEGVTKINGSKEEGERVVEQLKKEKQDAVDNMKLHLPQLLKNMSEAQRQMNEQYKSEIETAKLNLTAKSDDIIKQFEAKLSDITETYENSSAIRQQEFDKIVTQANNILEQLKNKLS